MTFKHLDMTRNVLCILLGVAGMPAMAQLNVNTAMTPAQLVQNVLVGGGVVVSNVTYNGVAVTTPQVGSGSFTNGNSTNLGLGAGLILSSGQAPNVAGPASGWSSDNNGTGSDPDLETLAGDNINDRAVLEFDFIPSGDSLKFNYVFGSEEYPEFVCSYNDAFGFFLSGPGISGPFSNGAQNIALIPGTTTPVTINNVNNGYNNNPTDAFCPAVNAQYYINNSSGTTIAFDGFTTVLQARAQVICGETYHIKLAIGDAIDNAYDSGVFLQAGSFQSNALPTLTASTLNGDGTAAEGCLGGHYTIYRPAGADSSYTVEFFFTGTATPGVDFNPLTSPVVIPEGQDSVVLPFQALEDGIAEGVETAILNVFVVNACGDTLTNSVVLAILDYTPMEIHSPTSVLLQCDQDSVPLYASVTGGFGSTSMVWGDSLYTDHIYVPGMRSGNYTVSATDQCPKTVSLEIHVDDGCKVIIPNVITPNGDGSNDRFVVEGIEGRDNQVQIWDRWGKVVLNTINYRNNFAATDLHDGVYFYAIRVLDKQYHGHLQVLGSK